MSQKQIEQLKAALEQSPDNSLLRKMLAETYVEHGFLDEAEKEYRVALHHDGTNADLQLGLAHVFLQQGKAKEASVVAEGVLQKDGQSAEALSLYVRALVHSGHVQEGISRYKQAIEQCPSMADDELEEQLGISGEAPSVVDGRVRQSSQDLPIFPESLLERPRLGFEDVGGMDQVKEEIQMKIIKPLQHPELYEAYGKAIGGGIMLYGPPGCGKTHLARATAGEVQAGFLSVGIHEVLDMWIGQSERNLHQLFEQARMHTPCVLFFDEVDAVGASRTDMKQSAGRQLINQFLAELDGVQSNNDGLLILSATNAPWHLDSAFRRPGRFDRIIFVPPPDAEARAAILRVMLKGKPLGTVDYMLVAKKTKGFSGADLKALSDTAIENKLRDAMKTGAPEPITTKDLLKAAKTVKPSTREWFSTARNYALYANESGLYDDVLDYVKEHS